MRMQEPGPQKRYVDRRTKQLMIRWDNAKKHNPIGYRRLEEWKDYNNGHPNHIGTHDPTSSTKPTKAYND